MSPRKVTIQDIADHVGVSQMTVSRAIRGSGRIAQTTCDRINAAAKELGYRPNASARAIQSGKFNTITWLSSTHKTSRYMTSTLLDGVMEVLDENQLQLHIARIHDKQLVDPDYVPNALKYLSCDGLLIDYTIDVPPRFRELVEETNIPAIWVNTNEPYDSVYPDDDHAVTQLTEQLIAQGHREIGYVRFGGDARHFSAIDRREGYLRTLKKHGLPAHVFDEDDHGQKHRIQGVCQHLIEAHPDVTAWISYGGEIALMLCMELLRRGIEVPNQVVVCAVAAGFTYAEERQLTLPIVATPPIWEDVGKEAVRMLLQKIESPAKRLPSRAVAVNGD